MLFLTSPAAQECKKLVLEFSYLLCSKSLWVEINMFNDMNLHWVGTKLDSPTYLSFQYIGT